MPDFATGGILINANEVYQALLTGQGAACKLRAVMNYNPDTNSILITELPYSVYSEVIKAQIHTLMENEQYGIKNIHDNTGKTPEIILELNKGVNPKKMIEKLYKDTSLENHFTINMWVLKDGRFPQVMGLRQIFQEYIEHIRVCKRREVQFDLDKALARKNIVDGLIKAYSIIDEVVATIRASSNPTEASLALQSKFEFNEEQAKAILAMKLSSLTKLDIVKLNNEREQLIQDIEWYQYLLKESAALDAELIKILEEVANKFGDARRTKILNLTESLQDPETIKEENLSIMLFDNNIIRLGKKEELQGGKRGRKGVNIKPPKNANLINTLYSTNLGTIAAFTNLGRMYNFSLADLDCNKDYSVHELITLQDNEKVILLIDMTSFNAYQNLITISKHGYIKKTSVNEYNIKAKKGTIAVKLEENDSLIGVYLSISDNDKIFIANNNGNYNYYKLTEVSNTGRATKGVKAIKLKENEYIISATIIKETINYKGILSITATGKGKITSLDEFTETSRAMKGSQVMALKDEQLSVIYAVPEQQEKLFISANGKAVLLDINNIPIQGRNTSGVRIIDARDGNSTIEIM